MEVKKKWHDQSSQKELEVEMFFWWSWRGPSPYREFIEWMPSSLVWGQQTSREAVLGISRREHVLQESVEQNKWSLWLESRYQMASCPHWRKRKASLVLLNISSHLHPLASHMKKKIPITYESKLFLFYSKPSLITSLSGVYQGCHLVVMVRLSSLTEYRVAKIEHKESKSPLQNISGGKWWCTCMFHSGEIWTIMCSFHCLWQKA